MHGWGCGCGGRVMEGKRDGEVGEGMVVAHSRLSPTKDCQIVARWPRIDVKSV